MGSGTSIGIKRAPAAAPNASERADWHRRASRLYEELRRPAVALIRRAYGATFSDDSIDDLYSSAWLGTLRALERRQARLRDDEIRSYLLTAVANQASKEIRRRKRKPVAPIEAAGGVPDEASSNPEDAAAARESSQVTRDLLSTLPPRRRAVMLLRYGWGLSPREVCSLVDGLSPRAYRKEITRGIDELTKRVKLVEEGRWCADREPLLKTYASGLADEEETLQAEHHLAHCRRCHAFVGKLTDQLHDLGSGILAPGVLDVVHPDLGVLDRLSEAGGRLREAATGLVGRSEPVELVPALSSARGAGAAGAGVVAKLAGLGTAGKIAVACLSGGAAATACVAAGIGPVTLGGAEQRQPVRAAVPVGSPAADPPRDPVLPAPPSSTPVGANAAAASEDEAIAPKDPVAPEAPPAQQEFGVAAAAAPAPSAPPPPARDGGGSGGGAVQQEFGP